MSIWCPKQSVRLKEAKNITVIPQHGSPTLAPELERVAIRDSSSVVLLADELATLGNKSNDIATIKSLMQLGLYLGRAGHQT